MAGEERRDVQRYNADTDGFRVRRSETPEVDRLSELREMRQEALSAVTQLEAYLSKKDALFTKEDLGVLRTVLVNVPYREGNVFFSAPERKNRMEKSAAVVPIGERLGEVRERRSARSLLSEYAQDLALPIDPELFAARKYEELVGDTTLQPDESVILNVDAVYGKDVPLPSSLVFLNVQSESDGDYARIFARTASGVRSALMELGQDYNVLSFPPLNTRADRSRLNTPESILAFTVGVLSGTNEVYSRNRQQSERDMNADNEPALDVIELVVSKENYSKFKDYRTLLLEILQQKIDAANFQPLT